MATDTRTEAAVVQQFIDEVVNGKEYDRIDDLFTDDYTRHDPASPEIEPGPDAWAESLKQLHAAFPDSEVHVGEVVSEGDLVAFEGTMTGTHRGEFRGVEPTDIEFEVQGNAMHRVKDGKIAETWATWDFLGILQQVGAVEAPTE